MFKKYRIIGFVVFLLSACSNSQQSRRVETDKQTEWEKLGPGGGGSTFIPAFSYHTTDKFLIRCDMTGSYLTNDGGNSYQQINFPNGASSFAYDPKDSNIIYIGSSSLNKSEDGGKTWKPVFPKKEEIVDETYSGDHANYRIETVKGSLYDSISREIKNIRVDPLISGWLYFSMGKYFFYTANNGKDWVREDCQTDIQYIYTNNETLKDSVFIFTSTAWYSFNKKGGAIKKRDLPVAMQPANSFTGGITGTDKRTFFYALHNNPDKTPGDEFENSELWITDNGYDWKKAVHPFITNEKAGIKPSFSMIACSEFHAEQAYLITNKYAEKNGKEFIYWYGAVKTSDAARTWQWVWKGGGGSGQYGVKDGQGVVNLHDAWVEKAFGGEYIRLMDAGVSPKDGNTAIITDWYRTMKTMDGGTTWIQVYSRPQQDGSFADNGMNVTTAYGVHFDPFDSNHIAISYTDIGFHHSYNGGKSWIRSVDGVPADWVNTCYWVLFDPDIKNKVWSAWSGMHDFPRGKMTRNPAWKKLAKGGICVSEDGGKTWKPTTEGMGSDSPATNIVLDTKSKPGLRTLYASVYNKGIFKSTDDGKTWTLKNRGIDGNTAAFELTLTPNGNLFVTITPTPVHKNGKKGREFYSGAVYKSSDGAETWKKLTISDGLLFPNGIAYDYKNPDRLYLACWSDIFLSDLIGGDIAKNSGGNEKLKMPGGIFLSEDGGTTWNSVFDRNQYVYDVTADPYHAGRLYANTFNQAAYRSDDYGKTWNPIKGYNFHWGHRAIIDPNNREKIYLTTYGSSVWHGEPVTEPLKPE